MSRAIEPALMEWLKSRPNLKGRVKFFPDIIPQNEDLPVSAYQMREHNETRVLRGRTGLKMSRITFVFWSNRRGEADELQGIFKDELDQKQGEQPSDFIGVRGDCNVKVCRVENEVSEAEIQEEGSDRKTYACQCDLVVWFTGG